MSSRPGGRHATRTNGRGQRYATRSEDSYPAMGRRSIRTMNKSLGFRVVCRCRVSRHGPAARAAHPRRAGRGRRRVSGRLPGAPSAIAGSSIRGRPRVALWISTPSDRQHRSPSQSPRTTRWTSLPTRLDPGGKIGCPLVHTARQGFGDVCTTGQPRDRGRCTIRRWDIELICIRWSSPSCGPAGPGPWRSSWRRSPRMSC
jgi:hypothetical protein